MGKGGTSFQPLAGWIAIAMWGAMVPGCTTSGHGDEVRSLLQNGEDTPASLAPGQRFGRWLEVDPEPRAEQALFAASVLERDGATEAAIGVLNDALDEGPACAALLDARGALYLATGFPRAAAGDFQRAVGLAPNHARSWYALGHAYEVLTLSRQALEALERACSLGMDEEALHLSFARVHRALDHLGLSAQHYERALELSDAPDVDLLVEAAELANEDRARAAGVQSLCERLEACRGVQLSEDAWVLRSLLREAPEETDENLAATCQALEISPTELDQLVRSLLTALQLTDSETSHGARERLLAATTSDERRAALERCLARP